MKIKTITCHKVNNHGANLQAYALMHYLEKLGNDVEIIDYCPEYFKHFRPLLCTTEKYASNFILKFAYIIVKFPSRLIDYLKYKRSKRKENFENFRAKYYKLTNIYESFEDLKNNPPQADIYIAGSDQIWNTMMNNGKDPSFYLAFVPNGKIKASYAASFSVSEIPKELKNVTKSYIENLDFVSVREKSALDILNDLGISNSQAVLDPVFLLDKDEWLKLESDINFDEKYILVYDFEGSQSVKFYAQKFAQDHNLKIYSLYDNDYCDKSFEDYGPDVFLTLIKNATFIVSNSFHATAFSIIYEKEFAVIKREEAINSRMVDLLSSLGLENRIVGSYHNFDRIDYNKIKPNIIDQIDKSKDFLTDVLEKI